MTNTILVPKIQLRIQHNLKANQLQNQCFQRKKVQLIVQVTLFLISEIFLHLFTSGLHHYLKLQLDKACYFFLFQQTLIYLYSCSSIVRLSGAYGTQSIMLKMLIIKRYKQKAMPLCFYLLSLLLYFLYYSKQ